MCVKNKKINHPISSNSQLLKFLLSCYRIKAWNEKPSTDILSLHEFVDFGSNNEKWLFLGTRF